MSSEKNVGGLHQIICGDRSSLTDARLRKSQRHLLLSVFKFAFMHKQFGELQPDIHAVRVRSVQCVSEAVHGRIALTQGQQGLTGGQEAVHADPNRPDVVDQHVEPAVRLDRLLHQQRRPVRGQQVHRDRGDAVQTVEVFRRERPGDDRGALGD